ncbi:MAG: DUF1559 domain-containing protein [Planctomycetes bacterium]|nr:DUF1559 domain-containing protein [Planctomycetota bacterium]
MSRVVVVLLIALAFALGIGIFLPAVYRARSDEEFRRCQNNLRQIGSIGLFHAAMPGQPVPTQALAFIPPGTLGGPPLLPNQRLSWYPLVLPAIEQASSNPAEPQPKPTQLFDKLKEIDPAKSWDDVGHQKLARTRVPVLLCPTQRPGPGAYQAEVTSYLGNGGLGANTPNLSIEEAGRNAGAFRYDFRTPLEMIRNGDGQSHTISIVESAHDLGPWLRGGPATIRCLDVDQSAYLGVKLPYGGCHRDKGNFAFADGSVHVLTDRTNPGVFRGLLTINGGETEEKFDDQ